MVKTVKDVKANPKKSPKCEGKIKFAFTKMKAKNGISLPIPAFAFTSFTCTLLYIRVMTIVYWYRQIV